MVMMEQAFWLILFLAVVGIAALIAAAMMWQKESIQQPGTPTGQRSYQEEYSAPDLHIEVHLCPIILAGQTEQQIRACSICTAVSLCGM